MMLSLERGTAGRVATILSGMGLSRDRYEDPLLFPPGDDVERQLGFFLSMVAIDHRTRTELTDFSADVDGMRLVGADLLYHLGVGVYRGEARSFTPEWLENLTPGKAASLLCFGDNCVWDFYTRIFLLRDLGRKMRVRAREGGGEVERSSILPDLLLVRRVEDLLENLSNFRAYEDPVRKKAFLLAKFLDGRGLVRLEGERQVPVDNHLTRVAIRLGIVVPSDDLLRKMRDGTELTREEDVEVRMAVREAWKEVSKKSGVDPFTLDDFLWPFGRTVCTEKPDCVNCPLSSVCRARSTGEYWSEPKHTLTWYY